MWEVEPTLYWRVKKNGKWTWVRAEVIVDDPYGSPVVARLIPEDVESE